MMSSQADDVGLICGHSTNSLRLKDNFGYCRICKEWVKVGKKEGRVS